jgi:hypothetical protein
MRLLERLAASVAVQDMNSRPIPPKSAALHGAAKLVTMELSRVKRDEQVC